MTDPPPDRVVPGGRGPAGEVPAAGAGGAGRSPDVNPDEIEADIREHVENELHPRPVPRGCLEAVLEKARSAGQWGAVDPDVLPRTGELRLPLGRPPAPRSGSVWNGPEDWRLAYLSFGVFAVGVLTIFVFPLASRRQLRPVPGRVGGGAREGSDSCSRAEVAALPAGGAREFPLYWWV